MKYLIFVVVHIKALQGSRVCRRLALMLTGVESLWCVSARDTSNAHTLIVSCRINFCFVY